MRVNISSTSRGKLLVPRNVFAEQRKGLPSRRRSVGAESLAQLYDDDGCGGPSTWGPTTYRRY